MAYIHRSAVIEEIEPSIFGSAEMFTPPPSFRAPNGELSISGISGKVHELDEGEFLLSSTHYSGRNLTGDAYVEFREIEELSYGREESGNVVVFGQLVVSSSAEPEAAELVAIKPRNESVGAAHEFAAMQLLNSLRGPSRHPLTFEAIGFCGLEGGKVGLVSKYDHPVQSYDNIFWNSDPAKRTPERISTAAAKAGFGLGAAQALGFILGDAEIKNIASANNGVRLVDLEETESFPATGPNREEVIAESALTDLRVLVDSLYRPDEERDGRYDELVSNVLLPNYARTTHLPTSRMPEASRRDLGWLRNHFQV